MLYSEDEETVEADTLNNVLIDNNTNLLNIEINDHFLNSGS
jgi:hypothetical protein